MKKWPPYPASFRELDYALRDGGWYDELHADHNNYLYAVENDGELIGMTVLKNEGNAVFEFMIVMHPEKTGHGFGGEALQVTLHKAFESLQASSVYLIVRKSNPKARSLYEKKGFIYTESYIKEIRGIPTEMDKMIFDRRQVK